MLPTGVLRREALHFRQQNQRRRERNGNEEGLWNQLAPTSVPDPFPATKEPRQHTGHRGPVLLSSREDHHHLRQFASHWKNPGSINAGSRIGPMVLAPERSDENHGCSERGGSGGTHLDGGLAGIGGAVAAIAFSPVSGRGQRPGPRRRSVDIRDQRRAHR